MIAELSNIFNWSNTRHSQQVETMTIGRSHHNGQEARTEVTRPMMRPPRKVQWAEGGEEIDRKKKEECNIKEWRGLEFVDSQRTMKNRETWLKKASVLPQRSLQVMGYGDCGTIASSRVFIYATKTTVEWKQLPKLQNPQHEISTRNIYVENPTFYLLQYRAFGVHLNLSYSHNTSVLRYHNETLHLTSIPFRLHITVHINIVCHTAPHCVSELNASCCIWV